MLKTTHRFVLDLKLRPHEHYQLQTENFAVTIPKVDAKDRLLHPFYLNKHVKNKKLNKNHP